MAYAMVYNLNLGPTHAGLTDLRAQLYDSTGTLSGAAISTGFTDLGTGCYQWSYAAFADSFRGSVKFYSNAVPATTLVAAAINPEEGENTNAKTTTRSSHSAADVVTALGTGTTLTAIPWNGAWDVEVQSECADALVAWGKTDFSLSATTGWGGNALPTIGSSTLTAQQVWGYVTRTISAFGFSVVLTSAYDAAKTAATQTSVDAIKTVTDAANSLDGKTLQQTLRYIAAATAGKASGAGTGIEVFVGLDGSTPRLTATVDADGNRTAITYG